MSGREETRGEFAAANLFPLRGEIDPKYVTGLVARAQMKWNSCCFTLRCFIL